MPIHFLLELIENANLRKRSSTTEAAVAMFRFTRMLSDAICILLSFLVQFRLELCWSLFLGV